MNAIEKLTADVGSCQGCPEPSHKVWVLSFVDYQVRLCRTCLADLKRATAK